MLGIKTGLYWRLCWGIIAPGLMFAILLYTLVHFEPPTYGKYTYSDGFSGEWSKKATRNFVFSILPSISSSRLVHISIGSYPITIVDDICYMPAEG